MSERELARVRKVPTTNLEAVDAELVGDEVHQPLDEIRRLRPPGAAVRVSRHLVREHADEIHPHGRDLVAAGHDQPGQRRNRWRVELQVRAEVRDRARPHAQNPAVARHRHFVVADLVAAVGCHGRVLSSRLNPLHRRPQPHGQVPAQRLFGVHVQLRPKPAADLGGDDAQPVLRNAEHVGQVRPDEVRHLRGRPDRERLFASVIRGDHRARLDRHRREPLVHDALRDDAIRAPERLVDVAALQHVRVADVRTELLMRQRRARRERRLGIDHDRQRVVVHLDRVHCVLCDVRIDGHRHRHGVADEVDALPGQHRVRGCLHVVHRRAARHQAAAAVHVRAGEHADDARERARRGGVDPLDARVGVRTPDERDVQQPGKPHVVRVGGDALNQPRVLDALHRASDVSSCRRRLHVWLAAGSLDAASDRDRAACATASMMCE